MRTGMIKQRDTLVLRNACAGRAKSSINGPVWTLKWRTTSASATFATHTGRNSVVRSCKHSFPTWHRPRLQQVCLSSVDTNTSYWLITKTISSKSTSWRRKRHRLLSTRCDHISRDTGFQGKLSVTMDHSLRHGNLQNLLVNVALSTWHQARVYAQSNGKAENAVKTAKSLLKKAKLDGSDPLKAILEWCTPTEGLESSPAQRLMSCRTRTLLPTRNSPTSWRSRVTPIGAIETTEVNQRIGAPCWWSDASVYRTSLG